MTTIHFIFRQSSIDKTQQGGISVRITSNRQSRTIALPLRIFPDQWDTQKKCSYCDSINQQLSKIREHILEIVESFSDDESCTINNIALRFRCQYNGSSLVVFAKEIAKEYIKNDQARTARAYMSAVNKLVDFSGNDQIKLTALDANLIGKFEKSLQNEKLTRNTISFYMRNLRALYNKAVQMHEIKDKRESPFAKVFTGIDKTKKRALSKENLNKINNANLSSSQNLQEARTLFLFGFHACGMSFVDMAYLRKKDIRDGVIYYRRKKTGRMVEVSITKTLQQIIDYFKQRNPNSIYLLPILYTQEKKKARLQYENRLRLQNKHLNEIGKLCKLPHPLTTHVCRHSWASIARNIHTPVALISESLGHSDEKTTSIYLASFDRSAIHRVSEQVSRMVDRPTFYSAIP